MAGLVDTNVLVYRFDPRFPGKQRVAEALLRRGIGRGDLRIPHQAILEFVAAVTRPLGADPPLLEPAEARREAEELLSQFTILYPNDDIVRTALRGSAAYGLSWFDAHLWSYAECYGLGELYSEDFQDGRLYGTVRIVNPFAPGGPAARAVAEGPALEKRRARIASRSRVRPAVPPAQAVRMEREGR